LLQRLLTRFLQGSPLLFELGDAVLQFAWARRSRASGTRCGDGHDRFGRGFELPEQLNVLLLKCVPLREQGANSVPVGLDVRLQLLDGAPFPVGRTCFAGGRGRVPARAFLPSAAHLQQGRFGGHGLAFGLDARVPLAAQLLGGRALHSLEGPQPFLQPFDLLLGRQGHVLELR
jgi:hypothetical protein